MDETRTARAGPPGTLYVGMYAFDSRADGGFCRRGVSQLDRTARLLLGLPALSGALVAAAAAVAGSLLALEAALVALLAAVVCGVPIAHAVRLQRAGTMIFDAAHSVLRLEQGPARREIPFADISRLTLGYRRLRSGRPAFGEMGRFVMSAQLPDGEAVHVATLEGPRRWKEDQALAVAAVLAELTGAELERVAATQPGLACGWCRAGRRPDR